MTDDEAYDGWEEGIRRGTRSIEGDRGVRFTSALFSSERGADPFIVS